jgi:hypothetical protein
MGPGPEVTFELDPVGNLTIGGMLTQLSDRNAKKNIQSVDGQEMLQKVAQLPIAEWTYKTEEDGVRHLGPMAQDFQAVFGLGDDATHLATMDTSGVALAAIQGLNEKLRQELMEKEAELVDQKRRIQRLEGQLEKIQQMLSQR